MATNRKSLFIRTMVPLTTCITMATLRRTLICLVRYHDDPQACRLFHGGQLCMRWLAVVVTCTVAAHRAGAIAGRLRLTITTDHTFPLEIPITGFASETQ